jgi:hypothetical protein
VIDVALTPCALRPAERIVVIDVLRATSTATHAIAGVALGRPVAA